MNDKEHFEEMKKEVKQILKDAFPESLTTTEIHDKCTTRRCWGNDYMLRKLKRMILTEDWLIMTHKTNSYHWKYNNLFL